MSAALELQMEPAERAKPRVLAFDIETVSNWAALSPGVRDGMRTRAERRATDGKAPDDPEESAALSPFTGRVAVVAIGDPHTQRGRALYHSTEHCSGVLRGWTTEPQPTEADLLRAFWAMLARNPDARLVSFNGRGFDGPFLMTRSAMLGIPCTRNLVPYRYSPALHADVFDVLSLYGATRGAVPGLGVVCEAFGVQSPKGDLTGAQVGDVWETDPMRVVRYCIADVESLGALYLRIAATLLPVLEGGRKW